MPAGPATAGLDGKRNASDSGKGIALVANDGPLESVGILASNVQRSPAASIFALRYDGPTFRLSLRASSSAYRSSDQPFRGGVRKQRSNFALVMGCRRIGVHVTAAGRA